MTVDTYDLIVIGSGPAGEKGAAAAAYFGKRVALVERQPVLGGAAANTGTLSSKTLRETALFLSGFRHRQLDGLDFRGLKKEVTVRDFMSREKLVVERERQRIRENLDRHGITLYQGTAAFVDADTVAVRGPDGAAVRLAGQFFLIATGASPYRPPGFDFADPRVYDSDTILGLRDVPRSLLVVGGGVIGCEYACMFAALGIQVTLVEKRERIILALDAEVAHVLQAHMRAMGVRLCLNDTVDRVRYDSEPIQVVLKSGMELPVHAILVSSGRCGNTAALNLAAAGIEVDERGRINVNQQYQTSAPKVYAAGDVINGPGLASTAIEQARVAMAHAFQVKYFGSKSKQAVAPVLPYAVYTIPECSMAGETEESLKEKNIPYVAGRASYAKNARGQIIGDVGGFLKLLFHPDDMRLLGVHVLGEQAAELVHVGLTALLAGAGADLFIQTCYNYPTLTELYKYATYDALGKVQGSPTR
jgi:NAD(P) transhydrogenase